ncbi:GNAT family N-acetyltransferase [Haloferula sp.]|uniref:GNAT family N-acetyltransferase n=1 Tax=Haloferula sp. TaxID=2497595 RepID=UPI00329AA47C
MNHSGLVIRRLTRREFDVAIDWAAAEGWNPGLHDADVFWRADPEGYLGAELDGELVATGSIVSYGREFGFMGFFIVRKDLRGQGIGTKLWYHRRDVLKGRLVPKAAIGMDGVFEMQEWYAKGGFVFSHRNLRMEGVGRSSSVHSQVVELSSLPFEMLSRFDRSCFGYQRDKFLKDWVSMPNAKALGYQTGDGLGGYGVIRKCQNGFKIGPLFADDSSIAEALFDSLVNEAVGQPIFLDLPEMNDSAMMLARRCGMKEVFGCARMYLGAPTAIDWSRVFGITTFELG